MVVETDRSICGLILGAGKSSRMGQPKLNLPWQNTTVLGSVITNLFHGGVGRIFVIYNPLRKPITPMNLPAVDLTWIKNQRAEVDDMLVSIQTGIAALPEDVKYVFICLGDQPTIRPLVIKRLIAEVKESDALLIFPSYKMRRGHPWCVGRDLWPDIMRLGKDDTVRTFIKMHEKEIRYSSFEYDLPADMDTPEEYQKLLNEAG